MILYKMAKWMEQRNGAANSLDETLSNHKELELSETDVEMIKQVTQKNLIHKSEHLLSER
ncbi:hypothetical protein [Longirhabdus pacifica]|uniref:hypothetical protein n=1 Tax=Longirhabdus pacifica TaxID=2305227 RepID=UPI001009135A|nr:hypothetical protein [Longirhabdus pacifica]